MTEGEESFGLFDEPADDVNDWKQEWKGMPECNNTDILPFKQLVINFKNKEDYEKFAALIKQTLTEKTKSTWFPEQGTIHDSSMRYVDNETEVPDLYNF